MSSKVHCCTKLLEKTFDDFSTSYCTQYNKFSSGFTIIFIIVGRRRFWSAPRVSGGRAGVNEWVNGGWGKGRGGDRYNGGELRPADTPASPPMTARGAHARCPDGARVFGRERIIDYFRRLGAAVVTDRDGRKGRVFSPQKTSSSCNNISRRRRCGTTIRRETATIKGRSGSVWGG